MSEIQPQPWPASSADDADDLFENAPCGYLVLTADGRIARANGAFVAWVGGEADVVLGKRLRDLLTVAGRIFYETNIAPTLRLKGAVEEVALDLVSATGDKVPLIVNASERRDPQGAVIAVRVIAVRAAGRRGYELDLLDREAVAVRQLADEQAISGLREQFIAVLGHDLRNPLAAVSSGVRLLQRDPSRAMADKIAGMMHASILRMSGMIDNVLDFARGRLGGGITLQRAPTDLETAVRQVIEELRSANPGRRIDETYGLPTLVDCDAPRLSQLVSNLVGNACAHGDPATFVTVEAFANEGRLRIAVANGGAPIPESRMPGLFDPFSHAPGSAPPTGAGPRPLHRVPDRPVARRDVDGEFIGD